jgi:uncharacterized protein (DUF433 family)
VRYQQAQDRGLLFGSDRVKLGCGSNLTSHIPHEQSKMDIQQPQSGSTAGSVASLLEKRSIVHRDPDIMSGIPVFIGTRVPLQTLFDYLEGEEGLSEFTEDFPHLKVAAIQVLETIARVMLYQSEILNAGSAG